MSSSDIAISVRELAKSYTIAHGALARPTFRDLVMDRLRHPLKRVQKETFWALKDVSFDIKKGDVVGIIGRNGAGKSTLLKILSRITEPTAGEVDLYGRVGSLLEVGTGFHPELSGRENIFLNGAILGMSRAEVRKQFDAIVDFAEVEQFLDTPVKRYSSGMYVRLAFAVAAHLRSEILLVDEVLAVGDVQFQKKCLGKMEDVSREDGRVVLFVSHNLGAVKRLCNRAVVLGRGMVEFDGPTETACAAYARSSSRPESLSTNGVRLNVIVEDSAGKQADIWPLGSDIAVRVGLELNEQMSDVAVDLAVYSEAGVRLFSAQSDRLGAELFGRAVQQCSAVFTLNNIGIACQEVSLDIGVRAQKSAQYVACWRGVRTLGMRARDGWNGSASAGVLKLPCRLELRGT